jgi:hypothetical protein
LGEAVHIAKQDGKTQSKSDWRTKPALLLSTSGERFEAATEIGRQEVPEVGAISDYELADTLDLRAHWRDCNVAPFGELVP